MEKIGETVFITSTFHFSGVDKADAEKPTGNLTLIKLGF